MMLVSSATFLVVNLACTGRCAGGPGAHSNSRPLLKSQSCWRLAAAYIALQPGHHAQHPWLLRFAAFSGMTLGLTHGATPL